MDKEQELLIEIFDIINELVNHGDMSDIHMRKYELFPDEMEYEPYNVGNLLKELEHDILAEVKELMCDYWDIAYTEGKTGFNMADNANEIIFRLDEMVKKVISDKFKGYIQ